MSYNYLPLDKNPTNFQQIKNLLAHEQLISITFDAHERMTKCRKYLDEKMEKSDALFYGIYGRATVSGAVIYQRACIYQSARCSHPNFPQAFFDIAL